MSWFHVSRSGEPLRIKHSGSIVIVPGSRGLYMSVNENVNILLVDDRPENLLALEAIVDQDGLNIVKASSGEEALRFLLRDEFAVILLDVQMPGIDGFETAKIIKAREKTKNVPILFITANNMESEHIFTGYSMGAVDYILKPFDPIILKAKVDAFVEIYKVNQILKKQTAILAKKTEELEKSYLSLSETTAELRISETMANVISETSIDSMIVMNEEGIILKANPAVARMFQYEEDELLGQAVFPLFSKESANYLHYMVETIDPDQDIEKQEHLKEIKAVRKDGSSFSAEIQVGKRFVQNQCIVACTIRDITNKKQFEEVITHMAYHDWLTNLPNRRHYNDEMIKMIANAKKWNQPLALLYVDMDQFKYINDSLGHQVGDSVLKKMAERLKGCLRDGDFIARVGGDEFNILLPNSPREVALEIAESLLVAFKQPFLIANYELFITACIGISVFPYDGEDPTVLVNNADAALYRAKELGKNTYKVFHTGMNLQSYRSFKLRNDLHKAIQREEVHLVYQPRLDLTTGKVTSAEALIRWEHPEWGIILPSEFIPLAEETGQIVEFGTWVLQEVCRQKQAWQAAGLRPIRIAVNFSMQQFLQKDLVEWMTKLLEETGNSPEQLEIEITESVLSKNEIAMVQVLNKLRQLGVTLSMDDFGMGYSSLNYIRKFPVHSLKIDRTFIKDLSANKQETIALITAIISLAHSLKMSVIAEGVETEEQVSLLRNLGCEEIQGYWFSPPISSGEFQAMLIENQGNKSKLKERVAQPLESSNRLLLDQVNLLNEINPIQNEEILSTALDHLKELYAISSREMDVFKLIVNGLSNKEISDQLFISEHTVKNHITRIFQKLAVNDRLQAMAKVYQTCIEEGKQLNAF